MLLGVESTRQDFHHLFSLYLVIALVVAGLVLGAIAYAAIRYRQRDGHRPRRPPALKAAEAAWVVLVAATVVVLLVETFTTEDRVDAVPSDPAQTVRVTGFQWGWRFAYPGTGVAVTGNGQRPPVLRVPASEPVRFELRSRDVIHSFWVPEERFKRDAFPNRATSFQLEFEPGVTTTGRCAEFCGFGHDRMDFEVLSMPRANFDRWLADRRRSSPPLPGRQP